MLAANFSSARSIFLIFLCVPVNGECKGNVKFSYANFHGELFLYSEMVTHLTWRSTTKDKGAELRVHEYVFSGV